MAVFKMNGREVEICQIAWESSLEDCYISIAIWLDTWLDLTEDELDSLLDNSDVQEYILEEYQSRMFGRED